jgi:hypothetical protein
MRHGSFVVTLTVGTLPPTMGLPARLAGLVPLARRANLLASLVLPTLLAAVALAAVATGTDGKHRSAGWVHTLSRAKAFDVMVGIPHPINIHGFE